MKRRSFLKGLLAVPFVAKLAGEQEAPKLEAPRAPEVLRSSVNISHGLCRSDYIEYDGVKCYWDVYVPDDNRVYNMKTTDKKWGK